MTVARVVFWTAMAVWGLTEVRGAVVLAATDRRQDRGTYTWAFGSIVVALAAALALDQVVPPVVGGDAQAPFVLGGAALVLAGVALRQWAIRTLGRFFTYQVATTDDQHVVRDGPYRVVRHPSYSALLLSCIGAGASSANLASLAVVIVLPLLGLTRRIRVEEEVLLDALGDDYRRYAGETKRLVPGIW